MALAQTTFMFRSVLEEDQTNHWLYTYGAIMTPQQMKISALTTRCSQELDNFLHDRDSDSRYGYELFRRALQQHDQLAWMAVLGVYENMVSNWVRQHPKFPIANEETTYFVNRAFERLWRNVALKEGKFDRFPNLPRILQFLKMCVNAAIIDDGLKLPPSGTVDPLPDHDHHSSRHFRVEISLTQQLNTSLFWQLIDAKLQNNKEKTVIYASFLHGMKPREIYAEYSNMFDSARQVGNIKSNALRRLARIPSFEELLREFIEESDEDQAAYLA